MTMELLNPLMWWGALAVAIPLILHFWHQKKGKLLSWAATQWLSEKNMQQSRGLKLDNLLLLALRILMILILVFYLSKPLIHGWGGEASPEKVHFVQPDKKVVENFRFEIEEAQKKGEKVFWLNSSGDAVKSLTEIPLQKDVHPLDWQSGINQVYQANHLKGHERPEIYFVNQKTLMNGMHIYVPDTFNLHPLTDTSSSDQKNFIISSDQRQLMVNAAGVLSNQTARQSSTDSKPVHSGAIQVLISHKDKTEKQAISAALKALKEVYQVELLIDEAVVAQKKYDWTFTDTMPDKFPSSGLLIVSGTDKLPAMKTVIQPNVVNIPFHLSPQTSDMVFNGELPEWIGEVLVKHYQLNPDHQPLSRKQLNTIFKTKKYTPKAENSWFPASLLLVFIMVLGTERWIAIRKNA
jgi:hypothetical protein